MDESLLQNQISPPAHSTSKYKRKRGLFEGDLGSDDDQFESVPYMNNAVKLVLFWIGVVLSGGWLGLFVLWFPRYISSYPALARVNKLTLISKVLVSTDQNSVSCSGPERLLLHY